MVETVLLVEKNVTGHRLYYVRLLAEEALRRGNAVVIALQERDRVADEVSLHLGRLATSVVVIFEANLDVDRVASLSHEVKSSLTVVPDGDSFAMTVGRLRQWPGHGRLSLLVMREVAQPGRFAAVTRVKSTVRTRLFRAADRIDNVRVVLLKSSNWSGHSSFHTAQDPVRISASPVDVSLQKAELGLADETFWFAVVGAISSRKNIALVGEALGGLSAEDCGLVLAGEVEQQYKVEVDKAIALLRQDGVSVVVVDRLLSDVELDAVIGVADCVVLAHSNEGPSGVLGKARALGTRVVAAGAKSLREDVAMNPEFESWSPLEAEGLRLSMRNAIQGDASSPRKVNSENFESAMLWG